MSFLSSYTLLPLRGTSPQGETRNLETPSFCLPDRDGAGRSPEDRFENSARDLTPLSSVACGATSFLWKEAINCGKAATFPLSASEHNPSTQSAAVRRPQPAPSGVPLFNMPRSGGDSSENCRKALYTHRREAAIPQPSARRAVKPKNLRGESPVKLQNPQR